jgi:hypothetical protein
VSLETQYEWLKFGQKHGWVSKQFCLTHDGPPMTSEEADAWDDGSDPCCFCVRLVDYADELSGGREGWGTDV